MIPRIRPAALMRNTRYLGFLAVFFFVAFAAYVPQPLSPNYLRNQQGLSLSRIGELISIAYLGNTLLNLLLGHLEARLGFILGQLGVAAFAAILWQGPGLAGLPRPIFSSADFVPCAVWAWHRCVPSSTNLRWGWHTARPRRLGLVSTLLAPPLAGFLYSRDPVLMYPVGLALIGLGVLITLAFIPRSGVLPPDRIELAPDH